MSNHPNRSKRVALVNYWTDASLDRYPESNCTLAEYLAELARKTHSSDYEEMAKALRKAFRDNDGKAIFALLRT